jgi:tRNA1(Val) A37 N6-methylase TrmN6
MSLSDDGVPLSEDSLLGGRVRLRQPVDGARVSIDPVFLAAAVPVEPGELVLDIGCGTGAAMLCVAARDAQAAAADQRRRL